jgi:hypothetical protein
MKVGHRISLLINQPTKRGCPMDILFLLRKIRCKACAYHKMSYSDLLTSASKTVFISNPLLRKYNK